MRVPALHRASFLAAAASAIAAPTIAYAAESTQLTIGIVPGDADAVIYYAQQLGLFKNAGLDVTLSTLNTGPALAAAVAGGALEIGGVNTASLASARLRGVPLRIISPAAIVSNTPTGDTIMVRTDSPIHSGSDLNGRTIGSNALGTLQHLGALSWIDNHGGDSKSVKIVEIPAQAMVAALAAGRVEAAILSEPWTSQGLPNNRALGSLYDAMRRPFLIFEFCATEQWLSGNAATAAKFATVMRQASVWANAREHDQERRAMNVAFTKLDRQIIDRMILWQMGTTLIPSMIQPVIDVMLKYGFLERAINPDDLVWKPS